ncbi:MFS transporter [Aliiruegeria lutimaris]|uniref:Major Facilitator Superfamily protein n=1 Tax=Aliiruegeria lutimaris TaxID=571298 RepID=A0A1G9F8N5_9RHOB|nr:MFS transporter [Aliiruegeria lutimaris]SDK84553.1 Major Facilitator Superfamily protein [Aliiruegeria lutimaris]
MFRHLSTLMAASFFVNLANAAITTMVGVFVARNGGTQAELSLIAAAYSLGFALGCLATPTQAARIGIIRVFAAAAAVATISIIGMDMADSALSWAALRFVMGASIAAVLAVSDTWINQSAPSGSRGKVIAAYSIVLGLASTVSQLVFLWMGNDADQLVLVFAILMNLSVVVIATTPAAQPEVKRPTGKAGALSLPSVSAGVGSFASGFTVAAMISIVPFYLTTSGVPVGQVAMVIMTIYLGRLLFQWPIGALSDKFDRRLVMAGLTLPILLFAVTLIALGPQEGKYLMGENGQIWKVVALVASLAIGASIYPMYSVASALAFDRAEEGRLITVSTTLLVIYSAGSISGPLAVMGLTPVFGDNALPVAFIAVNATLIGVALLRSRQVEAPEETVTARVIPVGSLEMVQTAGKIAEAEVEALAKEQGSAQVDEPQQEPAA